MVNIYKLKFTVLQEEIIRFLFIKVGETFTMRRLAKELEVSSTAIGKALPMLEKKELIQVEKDKETKRLKIELKKDNKRVWEMKRVENLRNIYASGLLPLIEEKYPGSTIILFGSYSRGDDNIKSDIDIAVIGSKEKSDNFDNFEKILFRNISLHFFDNLNTLNKEIKENLCNGIVLNGGIEF